MFAGGRIDVLRCTGTRVASGHSSRDGIKTLQETSNLGAGSWNLSERANCIMRLQAGCERRGRPGNGILGPVKVCLLTLNSRMLVRHAGVSRKPVQMVRILGARELCRSS